MGLSDETVDEQASDSLHNELHSLEKTQPSPSRTITPPSAPTYQNSLLLQWFLNKAKPHH